MNETRCFVQFMHPGAEHVPTDTAIKAWNDGPHRRKFLVTPGRLMVSDVVREDRLIFWGEWEPESRVVQQIGNPLPHGPHFLYEPYYRVPASYKNLQNTDSFVFGEQFHYTGCQQNTVRGPTQLRYLDRGSVVLFGSCIEREFVLDTVFVVNRWIDHERRRYRDVLGDRISEVYDEVTIRPWYANAPTSGESYRLYFGATRERHVEGMFSFFPCLPYSFGTRGFERPGIRIPGVITSHLTQGKKLNAQLTIAGVRRLWHEVVRQVTGQGLNLGHYAALPERVGPPALAGQSQEPKRRETAGNVGGLAARQRRC